MINYYIDQLKAFLYSAKSYNLSEITSLKLYIYCLFMSAVVTSYILEKIIGG